MKPAARLQTAIELSAVIYDEGGAPEETLLRWRRSSRYAGSSDRRAIDDKVYGAARAYEFLTASVAFQQLCKDGQGVSRPLLLFYTHLIEGVSLEELDALCSGERHAPQPLSDREKAALHALTPEDRDPKTAKSLNVPEALRTLYTEALGEKEADFHRAGAERAPTMLRIDPRLTDRESALTLLRKEFPNAVFTAAAHSPIGIRAENALDLRNHAIYQNGAVDLQDESGQIACILANAVTPVKEKTKSLDYCAGGGGKALTLASLGQHWRVTGSDVSAARLAAFRERAERGHFEEQVFIVEQNKLFAQGGKFDAVIVDAPCSGSGALRRNPFDKRRLTPEKIAEYQILQRKIMRNSADFVTPGGFLFYFTCSIFIPENEANVTHFLAEFPDFSLFDLTNATTDRFGKAFAEKTIREGCMHLSPHETDTDGFFIACFYRKNGA